VVVQILLPCIELPAKSGIGPVEQAGTFCIDVTCGNQNCELLEGGTTTFCKASVLTGSAVEVDAPMIVGAFTFFLAAAADSATGVGLFRFERLNCADIWKKNYFRIIPLSVCPLKN